MCAAVLLKRGGAEIRRQNFHALSASSPLLNVVPPLFLDCREGSCNLNPDTNPETFSEFMESSKLTGLAAKITVTTIPLVALVVHLSSTKFDTQAVVLLFIALLPWLASVISKAELPGGWKLEFQEVKSEQNRQAREIEALKFVVANFLTEAECRHLQGLASDKPYYARRDGTTAYFELELRRLRALGFIQGLPQRGVRSLLKAMNDAGGKEVNVKEQFELTPRGRDYLRLRNEMLAALPGSAETEGMGK